MGFKFPLFASGFISIPCVLVGLTSGKVGDLALYSFEGSSSMKDTIDYLVREYDKNGRTFFANIQAVGSNSGLEKLLNGHADFALVSQDVTKLAEKHKDKWDEQELRTITLGIESMVVLYKPPKNCSKELNITKENVKYIYSAFSGHKHKETDIFDWKYLLNKDGDTSDGCHGKIIPWAKSSGPTKSGTAYAFLDNPLLNKEVQIEDQDWLNRIHLGYGEDSKDIKYTSESNLISWNSFVSNLADGSIIYLPSSFVSTNIENINENRVRIAKLNGQDFDKEGYPWGRTYNLIYSTKDFIKQPQQPKKSKKQEFVKWILDNLSKVKGMNLIEPKGQDKDEFKSDKDLGKYGVPFSESQNKASNSPTPR